MNPKTPAGPVLRMVLLVSGILCVFLALIGIFLPLLPTTPFLLLAAAAFARSSPRAYQKLISNKYLGRYIEDFRSGQGIDLKTKIVSIAFLWIMISISIYRLDYLWVRILLLVIAISVTVHLVRMKGK